MGVDFSILGMPNARALPRKGHPAIAHRQTRAERRTHAQGHHVLAVASFQPPFCDRARAIHALVHPCDHERAPVEIQRARKTQQHCVACVARVCAHSVPVRAWMRKRVHVRKGRRVVRCELRVLCAQGQSSVRESNHREADSMRTLCVTTARKSAQIRPCATTQTPVPLRERKPCGSCVWHGMHGMWDRFFLLLLLWMCGSCGRDMALRAVWHVPRFARVSLRVVRHVHVRSVRQRMPQLRCAGTDNRAREHARGNLRASKQSGQRSLGKVGLCDLLMTQLGP